MKLKKRRKDIIGKLPEPKKGGKQALGRSMRDFPVGSVGKLSAVPLMLPRRRKTQWDYLLEEMKWMSEDFRQERVWKEVVRRGVGRNLVEERRRGIEEKEVSWREEGRREQEITVQQASARDYSTSNLNPALYFNLRTLSLSTSSWLRRRDVAELSGAW